MMKSTLLFRPESLPKGHWAVIEDMDECLLPSTQLTAVTSPYLHCQRAKLELWGRVSDVAFRATFRLSDGRVFRTLEQSSTAASSVSLMSCP